jgi:hypothetical protein
LARELLESEAIKTQWLAFRRKVPVEAPDSFVDVLKPISEFLTPVFANIIASQAFAAYWKAPGPWFND